MLTDRDSFVEAKSYAQDCSLDPNALIILVGTKSDDKSRQVTMKELEELAKEHGWLGPIETSAKYNRNVAAPFVELSKKCLEIAQQKQKAPYYQTQLTRLPQTSTKYIKLNKIKNELSQQQYSMQELKIYIATTKEIAKEHQDKGIKGFFKLTWARNPKSYNDINDVFDKDNNPKPGK